MALVRFNPAIEALRGKVGDWVYRHWYGKPVCQQKPNLSQRILTPPQQAQITRFAVAARDAPAMLAAHKDACRRLARATGKSEISVALRACYYHQPLEEPPGNQPPTP